MKTMTLMQHFSELRRRVLWTLGVFVAGFVVGWYVAPYVTGFITAPLIDAWGGVELLYTGLTDGLMIRLSLSAAVAMMIAIPVALWNVWAFIAPGLKPTERRFIWPVLMLSPLLFVAGAAFAFYVLFPFVFRFFIELAHSTPMPAVLMPAARDYLSFAIGMLKVFGLAFQLPLVLVLLNRIGFLPRTNVVKMRRYAIVIIVIAAAVLTPPDIVSQLLLAVPMWLLFETSVLFMRR